MTPKKSVILWWECNCIWMMIIVIVVVVVCVVDGFAISSVRKQQQQRMFATATIPQIAQLLERTTSTRSCQRKRTNSFLARSTSTDVYSILNRKRFISLWSTSSSASSNNNNHPEPIFYNDFEDYNPHSNHKSAVPYNNNNNQNQKQGNNDHVSNEQVNDETWITMTDARSVGGDWRAFRRNLTQSEQQQTQKQQRVTTTVAKQNEKVLETQNESLAAEFRSGVWAHETSTPEVGGLMVRMPLEVELVRNYKHSLMGQKLRNKLSCVNVQQQQQQQQSPRSYGSSSSSSSLFANTDPDTLEPAIWYHMAQSFIEDEMMNIAEQAEQESGQIDATRLSDEAADILQLYLDHQETWQEVALVIQHNNKDNDEETINTQTTSPSIMLVLNRPMALQLTENLGKLVFFGTEPPKSSSSSSSSSSVVDLKDFLRAFGSECAVYVGGPDDQHLPAIFLHGHADLPGSIEIAPGIYQGGIRAAVQGVLAGRYKPLEFKFFVGRHRTTTPGELQRAVVLGKYQPIACARSVALKQCIQLPKPLYHEVLELCGGQLSDISQMEMLKRDDLKFQIIDEDNDDDDEEDDEYEIVLEDDDVLYDDDDNDDDDDDAFYTI